MRCCSRASRTGAVHTGAYGAPRRLAAGSGSLTNALLIARRRQQSYCCHPWRFQAEGTTASPVLVAGGQQVGGRRQKRRCQRCISPLGSSPGPSLR